MAWTCRVSDCCQEQPLPTPTTSWLLAIRTPTAFVMCVIWAMWNSWSTCEYINIYPNRTDWLTVDQQVTLLITTAAHQSQSYPDGRRQLLKDTVALIHRRSWHVKGSVVENEKYQAVCKSNCSNIAIVIVTASCLQATLRFVYVMLIYIERPPTIDFHWSWGHV